MAESKEHWAWVCQFGALVLLAVFILLILGEPDLLDAIIARIHPDG